MDLEQALRTTASARSFTDRAVGADDVAAICELARFAPSGGNRQPWSVIDVRDHDSRVALRRIAQHTWRRYRALGSQGKVLGGAGPDGRVPPPEPMEVGDDAFPEPFVDHLEAVPALLAVCVDLTKVAIMDAHGPKASVVGGASIYPFVDRILLAARLQGLAGVVTTFAAADTEAVGTILGLPPHVTLAAVVALGEPTREITRLRRAPVEQFLFTDRWGRR